MDGIYAAHEKKIFDALNSPDHDTSICDRKKLSAFVHLFLMVVAFALTHSQLSESPSRGIESHDGKAGLQDVVAITASAQTTPRSSSRWPQLVDITGSTGIKFEHLSSPEQKYIVESMSGGGALIYYDPGGWAGIYFTNPQNVEMVVAAEK